MFFQKGKGGGEEEPGDSHVFFSAFLLDPRSPAAKLCLPPSNSRARFLGGFLSPAVPGLWIRISRSPQYGFFSDEKSLVVVALALFAHYAPFPPPPPFSLKEYNRVGLCSFYIYLRAL